MNKKELVAAVAKKKGLTQSEVELALDGIMDTIIEALWKEESVLLLGFGTFSVKQHAQRMGYNPSTKEKMLIPAKRVVKFRAGAKLEQKK